MIRENVKAKDLRCPNARAPLEVLALLGTIIKKTHSTKNSVVSYVLRGGR